MTDPDKLNRDQAADLAAQAAELQQANNAGFQALARQGIQLNGPDTLNLNVRLAALVEHLLGDEDSVSRQEYELAIQRQFADLIEQAETQIARAKLTAPAVGQMPPPSRLLRP